MDDNQIGKKFRSGGNEEISIAIDFILSNWRENIIYDIVNVLKSSVYAEDIFNLGLEILQENIVEMKWNGGSLKGYLRRICINKSFDLLRYGPEILNRTKKKLKEPQERVQVSTTALKKLVTFLGLNCTLVLWLYWKGYSYKKIGITTGYNLDTVKSKKYKCQRKLLKLINDNQEFKTFFLENTEETKDANQS